MLKPEDYYYDQFPLHMAELIKNSKTVHEHGRTELSIPIDNFRIDKIKHIPVQEKTFFICSIIYTFLIDQVIYTHFKTDYGKFHSMTMYPKLELGITGVNLNPWILTKYFGVNEMQFGIFTNFFIQDVKDFFIKNNFQEATWKDVKNAMLQDNDMGADYFGKKFIELLKLQ